MATRCVGFGPVRLVAFAPSMESPLMYALAAPFLRMWAEPERSALGLRSSRKSMTSFLQSTVSIIALIQPYFTTIVAGCVVRYRTGFLVSLGLRSSSKSNLPTRTARGGNLRVFTYPYSVIWLDVTFASWAPKSALTSTPIPNGQSLFKLLVPSTHSLAA